VGTCEHARWTWKRRWRSCFGDVHAWAKKMHVCMLDIYNRMLHTDCLEPVWRHSLFPMVLKKEDLTAVKGWRPFAILKIIDNFCHNDTRPDWMRFWMQSHLLIKLVFVARAELNMLLPFFSFVVWRL
jgi:hypothetical protein